MIIFFILFIVIYAIYYTFFVLDFFYKKDALDKIIFICLFIFYVWLFLTLYYIFCIICMGLFLTEKPHPFFSDTSLEYIFHGRIGPFILYVLSYYLLYILYLLFHIFCFWIIVLIFVPFLIIVPIPIIPFVLPIPLKTLLLIPFQKLTDRGILPLMRRIIFGIFSENSLKRHFINSTFNIYDFIYDNLKEMVGNFIVLNEPKNEKISKGIQDDKYKTSTVDDENEETSKKITKEENANKEMKKRVKEEYLICVRTKNSLNNYGENKIAANSANNKKYELDCNFDNLKKYIKIKI